MEPDLERSQPDKTEDEELDDDEGADFLRFLASEGPRTGSSKLPARGIKDFEPHGTDHQKSALTLSREAMYTVLGHERIHQSGSERAVWDPEGGGAWVMKQGGKWMTSVGKSKRVYVDAEDEYGPKAVSRLYLSPEEALWLVERGTLDLRWPALPGEEEDAGLPMTLQAAHAVFIGQGNQQGLTLEGYTVYQYLRRAGYIVFRAEENWQSIPKASSTPISRFFWNIVFNNFTFQNPAQKQDRQKTGPLVPPRVYSNYRMLKMHHWMLSNFV
jgi:tRNA-splicing endonuclease subunit Sen54